MILEASRKTYTSAYWCILLWQNELKSWCNYWFTSLNHMQVALTDLSACAKLMTVLHRQITICYWFLVPLYNISYAQRWTCTVHNHAFWSRSSNLHGLDPMQQWLVLNLSKCWGKTQPAGVRDMKSQRGWGHSKNCATLDIPIFAMVYRSKTKK